MVKVYNLKSFCIQTALLETIKQNIVHLTGGCFPSSARIKLECGKSVKMSELKCGDRVQAG